MNNIASSKVFARKQVVGRLALIMVLGPLGLLVGAISVFQSAGHQVSTLDGRMTVMVLVVEVGLSVAVYSFLRNEAVSLKEIGFRWSKNGFKDVALGCAYGASLYLALASRTYFAGIENASGFSSVDSTSVVIFAIATPAIAFMEEMVWRGYVLRRVAEIMHSDFRGLLVSSLGFGVYHFGFGISGIYLGFITGVAFGFLYTWRRSLIPSVFAHFIFDFIPVLFWALGIII